MPLESRDQLYERMKSGLGKYMPEAEIYSKVETAFEINRLKAEMNAVILGHNYMEAALYISIPDYKGDSLALCRRAAETDADYIVFCGVKFMAESAKILNPGKTVLIPSAKAGCSLAESITAEDIRGLKEKYPGIPVVSYVNTYADAKAESDICCTSGNAVKVVESLDSDRIIFLPDEYLAGNVARETGKKIIYPTKKAVSQNAGDDTFQYEMIGWHGRCEVHEKFSVEDIGNVRKQFPDVVILAHPECSPEVIEASDYSGSTSQMVDWVRNKDAAQYLLLTECSMADNIAAENPDRELLRLCSQRCPHMQEITLQDTLESLQQKKYVIEVEEEIREKAFQAVQRMIEIG